MKTILKTETGKEFEIIIRESDGLLMFMDKYGNEFGYIMARDVETDLNGPLRISDRHIYVSFDFKDKEKCLTNRGTVAIIEK